MKYSLGYFWPSELGVFFESVYLWQSIYTAHIAVALRRKFGLDSIEPQCKYLDTRYFRKSIKYILFLKSGRAKPTSGSVRKPSCFDSGKTCECRNRSGFRFDPHFDSSFLNFSSRPLNSTILYNNARIYHKTTNTYPLSNQFFNFYIPD